MTAFRPLTLAALLSPLAAAAAWAGPASDMAKAHIAAVAAADVPAVVSQYADDAALQWMGGPLNGAYTGASTIAPVWAKFAAAQGKLTAEIKTISEAANAAGATVVADVLFKGAQTIPVRYVMVYRDGKLATEVWQIAPQPVAK
jgi:ketosteroid isomerase-like protein